MRVVQVVYVRGISFTSDQQSIFLSQKLDRFESVIVSLVRRNLSEQTHIDGSMEIAAWTIGKLLEVHPIRNYRGLSRMQRRQEFSEFADVGAIQPSTRRYSGFLRTRYNK